MDYTLGTIDFDGYLEFYDESIKRQFSDKQRKTPPPSQEEEELEESEELEELSPFEEEELEDIEKQLTDASGMHKAQAEKIGDIVDEGQYYEVVYKKECNFRFNFKYLNL